MHRRARTKADRGSLLLWFGFLGGGVAWSLHLLASYLLAESACVTSLERLELFGTSGTLVLLMGITLVTAVLALAATLAALGQWLHWRGDPDHAAAAYVGLSGLLLSGMFLFIILVESLPPFFMGICV